MKAYIRIRHTGELYDRSCYAAYAGANELDIPVKPYKVVYSLTDNDPKDPVVGTFSDVKVALEGLNGEKTRGLKAAVKYVKEHDIGMTEEQIQGAIHM